MDSCWKFEMLASRTSGQDSTRNNRISKGTLGNGLLLLWEAWPFEEGMSINEGQEDVTGPTS